GSWLIASAAISCSANSKLPSLKLCSSSWREASARSSGAVAAGGVWFAPVVASLGIPVHLRSVFERAYAGPRGPARRPPPLRLTREEQGGRLAVDDEVLGSWRPVFVDDHVVAEHLERSRRGRSPSRRRRWR